MATNSEQSILAYGDVEGTFFKEKLIKLGRVTVIKIENKNIIF